MKFPQKSPKSGTPRASRLVNTSMYLENNTPQLHETNALALRTLPDFGVYISSSGISTVDPEQYGD